MHIATKSSRINISEEIETKSIAKVFSKNIKVGVTIFLRGELGVGKTTFVKYLINFLQGKNKKSITEISSPTFNLVHEYQLGSLVIKHYDLYRINNENELVNMSNNGISSQKKFLRFKEVLYSYKNIFGIFFFVPYTLRYIRRISIKVFNIG